MHLRAVGQKQRDDSMVAAALETISILGLRNLDNGVQRRRGNWSFGLPLVRRGVVWAAPSYLTSFGPTRPACKDIAHPNGVKDSVSDAHVVDADGHELSGGTRSCRRMC